MKKLFAALVALACVSGASADVNLDIVARYGNDTTDLHKTLSIKADGESTYNMVNLTHKESGIGVSLRLAEERDKGATFGITLRKGQDVVSEGSIDVTYGERAEFACPCQDVDASLTLTASSIDAQEQDDTQEQA